MREGAQRLNDPLLLIVMRETDMKDEELAAEIAAIANEIQTKKKAMKEEITALIRKKTGLESRLRSGTRHRNAAIARDLLNGKSVKELAREHDIGELRIYQIARRFCQLENQRIYEAGIAPGSNKPPKIEYLKIHRKDFGA